MIEYCLSNVDDETRRRLRTDPEATESPCLEHCGICRGEAFAIVDGTFRRLGDHEELLEAYAEGDR